MYKINKNEINELYKHNNSQLICVIVSKYHNIPKSTHLNTI